MLPTTLLKMAGSAALIASALLVALASPASAQLPEGPLDAVDDTSATACATADACVSSTQSRTVYYKGYLFTLSPAAVTSGGTVVSLSGSYIPSTSLSRVQGGTDSVSVQSGSYVTLSYSETTESTTSTLNTYSLSAIAIGNSAWLIVGLDVSQLDEYAILGWVTVGSSGQIGNSADVDKNTNANGKDDYSASAGLWGAVCLTYKCASQKT